MSMHHGKHLRRGRYSELGRIYLVTTVVAGRQPVFDDCVCARLFIGEMRRCVDETLAASLAWVVMPDHVHWLLALERSDLGSLMKRLKARSSLVINRERGTRGQLWQAGFHDRALRREEDVRAVARYVVANPLRAGLVGRLGDYPHWDACWL
ncbi:transposase [Pseudomonas sp. UL073]|uniref:Transposase n=1 Tax=Zestomonas insulae TaxID=2809017 RepID=A0ABS2ILJ3_9GAMM|nr:transposase [Pseudomonas insulae]MBM7062872.1 transposase [Pseudomonas insulae]